MSNEIIENLNFEKVALNDSYIVALQQILELRKIILTKNKMIEELNANIKELLTWKNLHQDNIPNDSSS
jgi:hypothetical protein